jgi:hypothetical protein
MSDSHKVMSMFEPASQSGTALPAADTRLHIVGNVGLLFSDQPQRFHVLNGTAAFVWSCLEDGMREAEVEAALREVYGVDASLAHEAVERLVADWQTLGLLAGSEDNRDEVPPTPRGSGMPLSSATAARRAVDAKSTRSARLLSTDVVLAFGNDEQDRFVWPVLQHLRHEGGAADACSIELVTHGVFHDVLVDGSPVCPPLAAYELAPVVKGAVVMAALERHPAMLHVHAGVVARGRDCLVLPAVPGSGKSCLTAALVRRGLTYLSDEVGVLDEGTLAVRPVPVSLCVKEPAWELLAPLYPELARLAVHRRPDGRLVRYLNPPEEAMPREDGQAFRARWIVFPRYTPGAVTALRALPLVEALPRLLEDGIEMPRRLSQADVALMAAWLEDLLFFELEHSDLGTAADLLVHMMASSEQG